MTRTLIPDPTILTPLSGGFETEDDFKACEAGAHGTYSTEQFVLRLSAEVHGLVDRAAASAEAGEDLSDEAMQGYSTYLHETVHWWQHIGSTAGLLLSLQYPAIAHADTPHVKRLLKEVGPFKPVRTWVDQLGNGASAQARGAANTAVHNAYDLTFFKRIALEPVKSVAFTKHRYFQTVGHCYWMAYGQALSVLSATVDRGMTFLPDGRAWDAGFDQAHKSGVPGFAPNEPVTLSPVGLRDLMEGQARFAQLQFLCLSSAQPPSVAQLRQAQQFKGEYGAAFDAFLQITGALEPEKFDDPLIGLFMLILDLAINPTRGLVFQIEQYEDFLHDCDPGLRFLQLCGAARDNPQTQAMVQDYTRDEFAAVSEILTKHCGFDHPLAALQAVAGWASQPSVKALLDEKRTHDYDPANLVIRVLFAYFVSFSTDKFANPEFFCWPGAGKAGPRVTVRSRELWMKYLSLFTDKANDDGIYPRAIPGVSEDKLVRLMTDFFVNVMVYDLTRQWIMQPGPFVYSYGWLSRRHFPEELERGARAAFESLFGMDPEDFQILY